MQAMSGIFNVKVQSLLKAEMVEIIHHPSNTKNDKNGEMYDEIWNTSLLYENVKVCRCTQYIK